MSALALARSPATVTGGLRAILLATAVAAIAVPAYVVTHAPAMPHRHRPRVVLPPPRVVPAAEVPAVEPVAFVDLSPDDARAYNAEVPFSTEPNPAARPFRFIGSDEERARATDCLAAGVIYEAGDDATGERAVAQVILNRLRHPAFPKTVCGVVFEGAERSTGCQFTFSCDGALTRWKPSDAGWRRAREVATLALAGSVYAPVGYATHYHTDWVVPYWQSSLDKIAAVHTHLFFRWSGWWGTPPAFNRHVDPHEPVIAQLGVLSDAHKTGAALEEAAAALTEVATVTGAAPTPVASDNASFLVTIPRGTLAEGYPALAKQACGERPSCKYSAWADPAATPTALPLEPAQIAAMTFSYLRDRATGVDKALWNCQQVRRPDRSQCMKQQVLVTAVPVAAATPMATATPADGPAVLDGVRRKTATAETPAPAKTDAPAKERRSTIIRRAPSRLPIGGTD
ncbi:cell wall hydrolase [Sphingomonas sp. GC_Shp_1]|uniref:cell wall hydrolase n=1 Tax=unclassified Sphingomonas TaxID=196159 RepID=UPI0022697F76